MMSKNGQLKATRFLPGESPYESPYGKPQNTGDFREKYNIQNMLQRVIWPKPYQNEPEERKKGRDIEQQDNQDIEQFAKTGGMIVFLIIGGIIAWRMLS